MIITNKLWSFVVWDHASINDELLFLCLGFVYYSGNLPGMSENVIKFMALLFNINFDLIEINKSVMIYLQLLRFNSY